MKKFYFILITIITVTSIQANVITGNFSICLPGPNTTQLSASALPAPITATTPWFSLNPAVATISSSGLVTAVSFGVTTISYTDNLGSVYSANVYVSAFPTITATNGTSTCANGGNLQLEGSLFPNVNTPWESLNPAIATIDNTGFITGVTAGVATILYRNLGGCTTTIPITINPLLTPIVVCGISTPTSRTFNWNAVLTAQTYVISYSINGGPFISGGSGPSLTYTLNGIAQTDNITLFVVPSGPIGSCFQVGTITCAGIPCPEAGTGNQITICESDTTTINLFSLITGEDLGGTWTRTTGTGGTFNALSATFTPAIGATSSTFEYRLDAVASCLSDYSVATINIISQPNAGLDGSITICNSSTDVINLFSLITGEQAGGTWTRTSGTGGTFNASAGTYTPASGATTSTFAYILNAAAPCLNDISFAVVSNPQPNDVVLSGNQSICVGSSTIFFSTISGGSWSSSNPAVATVNSVTGLITSASVGVATINYTIVASTPCVNTVYSRDITVNAPVQPSIDGFQGVCVGSNTVFSATPSGGIWSSSDNTIVTVDSSGFIQGIATGTAIITYTILDGCVTTTTASRAVIVSTAPSLQLDSSPSTISQSLCVNSPITPIIYSVINFVGVDISTVGLPTGVSGSLNLGIYSITGTPLVAGTYQYTIIAADPCGSVFLSGTIVALPNSALFLISAPYTADQSVCLNSTITPIDYFTSSDVTGASVVGLPDGVSGSFNLGVYTISGTSTTLEGVFSYTISTTGGCGVDSMSGTITVSQQVSTSFFCDPSQATSPDSVFIYWNDVSGSSNYEFTYSINDGPSINGSTIDPFYEILNVLPGQSVLFTLTNVVGVSCFQSASTTCTNLANESFESEVFQSFPNPIDDILNIKSLQSIKNIQIYNLVGQQVFANDYNEKEFQLNLSHLTSGSYLVKAFTVDSIKTFKILKN